MSLLSSWVILSNTQWVLTLSCHWHLHPDYNICIYPPQLPCRCHLFLASSLSSLLLLSISYYYYYYLYHHIIIGISIFALTYFPGLSPFITLKSEIRCQTEFQTTLCRTSIPVSVSDGHHNHHLVIVTNFISINIIINTIQLHEDHQ